MKKLIYLLLLIFIAGPALQSCGSSKRGCKNMRKYRKYSYQPQQLVYNQANYTRC